MKDQLRNIFSNPIEFVKRLKIKNKKGCLVNLWPNSEQLRILNSLVSDKDTLVLKPRQIGSTTIICAFLFYIALTSTEPITIAILSHKLRSAKQLLKIYKTFYDSLPDPIKPKLLKNTTTEMVFPSGATIMAVSAQEDEGLRSFTANYLHISEFAFAENPDELLATALAALNENKLIIESTANHYNDALHREIQKHYRGEGKYDFLFFPWTDHEEYQTEPPSKVFWDSAEQELIDQGLSPAQVFWRRTQVHKFGIEKFLREYPLTVEEAYQQTGNVFFTKDALKYVEVLNIEFLENKPIYIEKPNPNTSYAIGADTAAGAGRDYSSIFVLDKATYQPVCLFRSNTISISALADMIARIGIQYNNAKVLVESNNYGHAVLAELRHLNYANLWKTTDNKDFQMNHKTKVQIFEELRQALSDGAIHTIDPVTFEELRSFIIDDRGNISYPPTLPSHGDNVIALALAFLCLKSVSYTQRNTMDDFIMRKKVNNFMKHSTYQDQRRY